MQANRYKVARLNKTITFGKEATTGKRNPNTGKMIKEFKGIKKVHCGNYSISTNQSISLAGASVGYDLILVVRHNPELTDLEQYPEAEHQGNLYKVVDWNIDDDSGVVTYDTVTLKKQDTHR